MRAMHTFTLHYYTFNCGVFSFSYVCKKKTTAKRKSHWQPANHNIKKWNKMKWKKMKINLLSHNEYVLRTTLYTAYICIHMQMQMHMRLDCLATGCGISIIHYSISIFTWAQCHCYQCRFLYIQFLSGEFQKKK